MLDYELFDMWATSKNGMSGIDFNIIKEYAKDYNFKPLFLLKLVKRIEGAYEDGKQDSKSKN